MLQNNATIFYIVRVGLQISMCLNSYTSFSSGIFYMYFNCKCNITYWKHSSFHKSLKEYFKELCNNCRNLQGPLSAISLYQINLNLPCQLWIYWREWFKTVSSRLTIFISKYDMRVSCSSSSMTSFSHLMFYDSMQRLFCINTLNYFTFLFNKF